MLKRKSQAMRIAKAYDVPIFNLYFDSALDNLGQWLRESGHV